MTAATRKLLALGVCLAVWLAVEIEAHGKMTDPPNRSSLWRNPKRYRHARANNQDNENFCGGFMVQQSNGGKCGPCGDNYRDPVPRKNENTGIYGRGKIVKRYHAGAKAKVTIDVSANHLGHFEFHLCSLKSSKQVETEECFEQHPLKVTDVDGKLSDKYHIGSRRGLVDLELHLPKGFKCKRCVLRWHYKAGNNWGMCGSSGKGKLGCGPQETFRSCADVAIA